MHAVRTNIIRFSLKISAIQKMEHTSLFPEWLTILKKDYSVRTPFIYSNSYGNLLARQSRSASVVLFSINIFCQSVKVSPEARTIFEQTVKPT